MDLKYGTLDKLFIDIADSIGKKKGATGDIIADEFPDEIKSISVESEKKGVLILLMYAATASDIKSGKMAYVNDSKIESSLTQLNKIEYVNDTITKSNSSLYYYLDGACGTSSLAKSNTPIRCIA